MSGIIIADLSIRARVDDDDGLYRVEATAGDREWIFGPFSDEADAVATFRKLVSFLAAGIDEARR